MMCIVHVDKVGLFCSRRRRVRATMEDINVLLGQILTIGDMTLTDADVQEWCVRARVA